MALDRSLRARLGPRMIDRFSKQTLFDRIARVVCRANCLPRKELYESWEVARRVRRHYRGGRVIDLAAGHGLLAAIMLILDDSSPEAFAIDRERPASAAKLLEVLTTEWPRLEGRIHFLEASIDELPIAIENHDIVVSVHACGALTDRVLEVAIAAGARVGVLPCCHEVTKDGALHGWLDGALAIDVARATRLLDEGYVVRTQTIPEDISPKNRLLLGAIKNV